MSSSSSSSSSSTPNKPVIPLKGIPFLMGFAKIHFILSLSVCVHSIFVANTMEMDDIWITLLPYRTLPALIGSLSFIFSGYKIGEENKHRLKLSFVYSLFSLLGALFNVVVTVFWAVNMRDNIMLSNSETEKKQMIVEMINIIVASGASASLSYVVQIIIVGRRKFMHYDIDDMNNALAFPHISSFPSHTKGLSLGLLIFSIFSVLQFIGLNIVEEHATTFNFIPLSFFMIVSGLGLGKKISGVDRTNRKHSKLLKIMIALIAMEIIRLLVFSGISTYNHPYESCANQCKAENEAKDNCLEQQCSNVPLGSFQFDACRQENCEKQMTIAIQCGLSCQRNQNDSFIHQAATIYTSFGSQLIFTFLVLIIFLHSKRIVRKNDVERTGLLWSGSSLENGDNDNYEEQVELFVGQDRGFTV